MYHNRQVRRQARAALRYYDESPVTRPRHWPWLLFYALWFAITIYALSTV